jgi:hypothetical protein
METFVGIFFLVFVIVAMGYLLKVVLEFVDGTPSKEALLAHEKAQELRRVELELRALEHRAQSPLYSRTEAQAYALLIERRNELAPPPVVERQQRRARPVAARLA